MPIKKNRPVRCRYLIRPVAAALAAFAGAGAMADEPNPYYIGASQSLTRDSNVYRTPNGVGDTYSSTGLLGGFDQPIGRQRIYGTANVSYNKYLHEDALDHTSYGIAAGWDWATIDRLSGSVGLTANQSLASLNGGAGVPLVTRNVVSTDQLSASLRWGGESRLNLQGDYAHSRVRYSAPEYLSLRSSADSFSVGTYYRLGADIRLGTALRFTRTESPYALALVPNPQGPGDYQSNTADGRNLDLSVDWRTTAQTGVNARISWTRQSNSNAGGLDFSGLTGALTANYAPTAKLAFNVALSRDAGTNGVFFNVPGSAANTSGTTASGTTTPGTTTPGAITPGTTAPATNTAVANTPIFGLTQNSQTTNALSLGASYQATAKITANAGLLYQRAKLVNSAMLGAASMNNEATDTNRSATLGIDYAILRNVQLGCKLARLTRSVGGSAGFSYGANSVGCSAQLLLR